VNDKQKENTAKALLDLSKVAIITFVIGGFIPGSPITLSRMFFGLGISIILYIIAMLLLK
jgi:hypothetical protein